MRKIKPLGNRFLQDAVFRTRVTLWFGLCVNQLFFILDLYTGLRARSVDDQSPHNRGFPPADV